MIFPLFFGSVVLKVRFYTDTKQIKNGMHEKASG
jgi:hypothetical protein